MTRLALSLACLSLFACSGDNTVSAPDGSTADATADHSASDAAGDSSTDGGAGDSAVADAALPDASFACTDPTNCDGGAPFCCAQLVLGAGSPPGCPVSSISSACAAQCATDLKFTCSTTETVRFCAANADCTEQANPKCCVFKQNNQQLTFCVSSAVASFADHCL